MAPHPRDLPTVGRRSFVSKVSLAFVIVLASYGGPSCLAAAAAARSAREAGTDRAALSVSPAILERVLDAGVAGETSIAVTNVTEFPIPVRTTAQSFLSQEEIDEEHRHSYDASTWFQIAEPDFVLQPHERRDIKMTITPPAKAEPGGHYSTILFQPMIHSETTSPGNAQLIARVGVQALLVITGEILEKVLPVGTLHSRRFYQSGPIDFSFRVHNQGNIHVIPTGRIVIYDWRGRRVASVPIQPSVLLPGTRKDFRASWERNWPAGRYRAVAEIVYGTDQKRVMLAPVVFWAVPFPAIATVGVVIGLVLLWTLRRRLPSVSRRPAPVAAEATSAPGAARSAKSRRRSTEEIRRRRLLR
jgi:hypothetical protein